MNQNTYKMLKVKAAVEKLLSAGIDTYSRNTKYEPHDRHFRFYHDVREALVDLHNSRIIDMCDVTSRSNAIEIQLIAYGNRTRITQLLPTDLLRPAVIPEGVEFLPPSDYKLLHTE